MAERFGTVPALLAEYDDLEKKLADPSIHADQTNARKLGKRYAQLGPVIAGYRAYKSAQDDFDAAKELAEVDESFKSELPSLEANLKLKEEELEELLANVGGFHVDREACTAPQSHANI